MKHFLVLGLVLAVAPAFGQEPKQGISHAKPAPKKSTALVAPVTRSEARATSLRVRKLLQQTLGIKASSPGIQSGSVAVTREEVIADFAQIYETARPAVKFTPIPVRYQRERFRIATAAKPKLEMLVKLGAVAPYGPLATSKKSTISIAEYGDAVGFFLARISELSHMPSRKWTPVLQDPNG